MKTKTYLSKIAKNIVPYKWEEGIKKEILRFDGNTMPFVPPCLPKFLKMMENYCPINDYTDPSLATLKKLIADYEMVKEDMITITNSGDEGIDILAKTFLDPEDICVITSPTYEMFSTQCEINRGTILEIPLAKDTFIVNAEMIIESSKNPKLKLIFLVSPNNPTASIIPLEIIEKIVKESDAIVVVDEVYREYYGKTAVPFLKKYNNLVILRSFSKFAGIAGARIGYLVANVKLSSIFDTVRLPLGVSYFSAKLAEMILDEDSKWITQSAGIIKKERYRLTKELIEFGFKVFPSKANFLLVYIGDGARAICKKLKEKNILIRDRSSKKYLNGCVRITVRSKKENNLLLKALKEILYEK